MTSLRRAIDDLADVFTGFERARRPRPRASRDLNPAGPSVRDNPRSLAVWAQRVGRPVAPGELLSDLFAEMKARRRRQSAARVDPADLVGAADIARMFGVGRNAVTNWAARDPDFPRPVARLASGPVYSRAQVHAWRATTTPPPAPSGTLVDPSDLAASGDIAAMLGVTTEAVSNWTTRHSDFPKPVATVAAGPVYSASDVLAWHQQRATRA